MVTGINQFWESNIEIGGYTLPSFEWTVDAASYGQLSHSTVRTTISALQRYKINVPSLNGASSRVPAKITMNGQTIFGGTYRHGFFDFDRDEAEFFLRDYAAILFDTKRSIADIKYDGVTVKEFISNLTEEFGNVPGGLTGVNIDIESNPLVGTVFAQTGLVQGGSSMSTYPRPIWDLIVLIAKWIGANVFTTPEGILNFIQTPKNPIIQQYTWMQGPDQAVDVTTRNVQFNPILKLNVMHQPENNQNFNVVVISHTQNDVQWTSQTTTAIGEDFGDTGIKPKLYSGADGVKVQSLLSSRGLGIPTYYFPIDGLTADQAQSRADAIASEYAKRLYVVNAVVDGNPEIRPLQQFLINEGEAGSLIGFAQKPLYISGVRHSFSMPQGDSLAHDGFQTTIKNLTLPPTSGVAEQ